jgi:hypothetical protein
MIARELHVAEDKVRDTVEKMLTPVTPNLKATALELALERLDQYQASQHQDAWHIIGTHRGFEITIG